jgi:hypothetical protein
MKLALDPGMTEFRVDEAHCDFELSAEWADAIEAPAHTAVFRSGGLWQAYRESAGTSLFFSTPYLGKAPYKKCWFSKDLRLGKVWLLRRYFDTTRPVYPLEYPLDELLMIHRLGRGEGVEIHGCGVICGDGLGRLFIGHSGAGKSTASRLWLQQRGARVLSDDRMIVRIKDGTAWMHGTPWHGDAGLAEQACGRLHRIYLLQQAPQNEITPLTGIRASAEIFSRAFVPHYEQESVARILAFIERLTAMVPSAVLRCTADSRAVEEVIRAA